MLRSLMHNPRRRGLLGALLLGSVPYVVGAYNNGLLLGFDQEAWIGVLMLGAVMALIGYCGFHGGFVSKVDRLGGHLDGTARSIHDRNQRHLLDQTGMYTSMREQWDPNYMRDKY